MDNTSLWNPFWNPLPRSFLQPVSLLPRMRTDWKSALVTWPEPCESYDFAHGGLATVSCISISLICGFTGRSTNEEVTQNRQLEALTQAWWGLTTSWTRLWRQRLPHWSARHAQLAWWSTCSKAWGSLERWRWDGQWASKASGASCRQA